MSFISLNLCGNFLASGYDKPPNFSQIKFMIFFFHRQHFCILVSQVCVWWEISLLPLIPHLSSFIFTPSMHTHTHTDDPGQLKIYLPKKLLECLPKCSSLPKERHRWNTNEVRMWHTREGNIYDSEASRSPVTHLWQMSHREMKSWQKTTKKNKKTKTELQIFFYDPKTVTPRNKRYQPKPTKESYSRFTFHVGYFALYSKKLF